MHRPLSSAAHIRSVKLFQSLHVLLGEKPLYETTTLDVELARSLCLQTRKPASQPGSRF